MKPDKLSRKTAILHVLGLILSIPIGAIFGLILGLISTTFIPMCCNDNGCHNCLVFRGMVGYEATAYIGIIAGAIIFPLLLLFIYIYRIRIK